MSKSQTANSFDRHKYHMKCYSAICMRYSNSATNGTALKAIVQSIRRAFASTSQSIRSIVKPSKCSSTSALMDPSLGPSSELLSPAPLFSAKLCWPEGCFLNKSRGTVTFADKGPRRRKKKKSTNSAHIRAVSMFKGEKMGKKEEEHRQLITRTGSTPWVRNVAVFTACFPFYDHSSARPNTVQQGRMET